MGQREPFDVFNNVAVSSTNTYKSTPTVPSGDGDVGYCVDVTGTPVGTLTVEISNATTQEIAANADAGFQKYTPIPDIAISGASSNSIKLTNMRGFKRVRLKYVNSSSSGNIKAMVMGD